MQTRSSFPEARADRVSLAQWSLVDSIFVGNRLDNLDFPKIAREEFGVDGIEYVNQFFENPVQPYLRQLKSNADDHGITAVRIMVDQEGDMAALDAKERAEAAVAQRKWVDIAHYLGCEDIRCNMRGGLAEWKQDRDLIARAAESFRNLLDYSEGSGLNIVIENHGGASSDPDILVALMQAVDHPRFGTLPDFGNINPGDDPAAVIRKIAPYAKGVSVKAAWKTDGTNPGWNIADLIHICRDAGYKGWWGIESSYGPRLCTHGAPGDSRSDLTAGEIWDNERQGVRLTKSVIEEALRLG